MAGYGGLGLGASDLFPRWVWGESNIRTQRTTTVEEKLYSDLLRTWCDGLIARQVKTPDRPEFRGGFLFAACGLIHGRCGDAVYPLLRMAHSTGDHKYLDAALEVHGWSERMVSRPDGSWVNDVSLSTWKGITVFHAIALAEAIEHHGAILDGAVLSSWKDRLARAAKFLNGFITIETGNVNYPATSSLAFVLCGRVLGDERYVERGRGMAHAVLAQFTGNGFLAGEGHPLKAVTPNGCMPVDLGYNVEESLPALAMYAVLMNDAEVLEKVTASMKTHLEFMLPDGGWDNSWGTRNYKWTWWGSRTSDGCHPGLMILSGRDARFREAARRNAELMAACTHDGLLYGGPDYFAHGDAACVHHTFTHAKSLATVLDRATFDDGTRPKLPRDEAYGLRSFPEIGTHLAAIGPWRATVTNYDFEYVEGVQSGSGGDSGGGHASGGALSLLYHMELGPMLVASMTKYAMIEISNQQAYREESHMTLTPRVEYVATDTYTSLDDLRAEVKVKNEPSQITFDVKGRLLTTRHQAPAEGDIWYRLSYKLREDSMEIKASAEGNAAGALRLIVPVLARGDEKSQWTDAGNVRITKAKGALAIGTDAAEGFERAGEQMTFNLVPGFEAMAFEVLLPKGKDVGVTIRLAG